MAKKIKGYVPLEGSKEQVPVTKGRDVKFLELVNAHAPEGMKYCICEHTEGKKKIKDLYLFTEKHIEKLKNK